MYNSKLYSILEHFSKYEQSRFRKYLKSPYFNKNQTLIDLFELLIKNVKSPKANGQNRTKESIWQQLIPNTSFDDVRFRKYFSDLLKLVEGFLSLQIYEESPVHQATYLIEAVGRKKMEKLYNSTMKSARRLSNQKNHRSADYFFQQYQIEKKYYNLTEFETKRSDRANVEEISNNLDYFYLAEKLRYYCTVLSRQYLSSYNYELSFMKEVLDHVKRIENEEIPPIALYYQIYLTYTESDKEEHYFKLKNLLDKYALLFPINEAKDELYMSAQNYCIRKINRGNQNFLKELFILYQDLLEREIIFAEGELSPWYFRNIVVVALRLGEYKWTENFIQSYQKFLPGAFRENAVTYSLAQLYFYQKKYDKVIEQLQFVEYEDVTYNLNSKTMLLATYYETDEIEPLYSLLESFRAYLNRHKDIAANKRRHYLNLIKFTRKLTKILPGDKKAIQKLKDDIQKTKGIVSLKWLKEKIIELE